MSEAEKSPDWIAGQIAVLGVAIGVLIADQPTRNVLLASITEQLDQLAGSTKSRGIRAGIASARRLYIPPPLVSGG